ncbi:hypothetical protein F4802DRAFT_368914 [Xylaria palmicola]|nr:hypothetical protein F4802DRAFT_368914 [Xylaria palmicola]
MEKFKQLAGEHAFHAIYPFEPDRENDFNDANEVAKIIGEHLGSFGDKKYYFVEGGSWDFWTLSKAMHAGLEYIRRGKYVPEWQIYSVFRPINESLPHANCILVGGETLPDDELLFSELRCLLMLILIMLYQASNEVHKIIPITMVSLYAYKARILQGHVNFRTGKITINKTPIFNLAEGEVVMEDNWVTIFRWLVGTPVGETT